MRFLAFSDFHAHNFVEGSTRVAHYEGLPGLFNSRLIDACKALDEIRQYAVSHDIKVVLFGGDLFHSRTKVDVDVLNAIKFEFKKFNDDGIKVIAIPGNHDYADKNGDIHSLSYLGDFENFILLDSDHGIYDLGGYYIHSIPYSESKQDLVDRLSVPINVGNNYRILLGHFGIQGATVGSDYVMVAKTDLSITDVLPHEYSLCLFGHYHEHQKLCPNAWFIGATFQHNWGDANTKRGFLDISLTDGEVDFIKQVEVTSCTTYHTYKLKSEKDLKIAPNSKALVRVSGSDKLCTKFLAQHKDSFLSVQAVPEPEIEVESPEELPEATIDPHNMIDFWVDLHDGIDSAKLKGIGKALLTKANEGKL